MLRLPEMVLEPWPVPPAPHHFHCVGWQGCLVMDIQGEEDDTINISLRTKFSCQTTVNKCKMVNMGISTKKTIKRQIVQNEHRSSIMSLGSPGCPASLSTFFSGWSRSFCCQDGYQLSNHHSHASGRRKGRNKGKQTLTVAELVHFQGLCKNPHCMPSVCP